ANAKQSSANLIAAKQDSIPEACSRSAIREPDGRATRFYSTLRSSKINQWNREQFQQRWFTGRYDASNKSRFEHSWIGSAIRQPLWGATGLRILAAGFERLGIGRPSSSSSSSEFRPPFLYFDL